MPTDVDKLAAATLTAAMLRQIEPTGSVQEDARLREQSIRFADRLYRDVLAAIQAPGPEAASTPASITSTTSETA